MTVRTHNGVRLVAVALNICALVAPLYVWLAIAQLPFHEHMPMLLMGVATFAPVVASIAIIARPER
jgi:hypothetical protein